MRCSVRSVALNSIIIDFFTIVNKLPVMTASQVIDVGIFSRFEEVSSLPRDINAEELKIIIEQAQ